jgi:hypothetical protein
MENRNIIGQPWERQAFAELYKNNVHNYEDKAAFFQTMLNMAVAIFIGEKNQTPQNENVEK